MFQDDAIEAALAYHRRSKHHLHTYAASPGALDWATQPDPFRTFAGADRVELPLLADGLDASYPAIYRPGAIPPLPLERTSVAMLFELALGLSAWKEYRGTRWALRCNPSSGNLHPTEGYAILPAMPGLSAGVYHYVSRDHVLERRAAIEGQAALALAVALPPASMLVGLSSIHWREAWKYGERAFRYCQHDVGHAIGAVRYAAAALGWEARLLSEASDPAIADVLGLSRPESFVGLADADREHPDTLLLVGPSPPRADGAGVDLATLRAVLQAGAWAGRANALSPAHVPWPAIDAAAEATWREDRAAEPGRPAAPTVSDPGGVRPKRDPDVDAPTLAARLIKQRRSALGLDGHTAIAAETFYGMLDRLLPRSDVPPWDVWPWPPHLHCGLFVHRVRGIPAGLYLLERSPTAHAHLRAALGPGPRWDRPPGCPADLPLFILAAGDFREAAEGVSCHQAIAADGAFSLGMLADLSNSLHSTGAWWYRALFWEAGLLGQVLYLEAEAAGVRGTGIGCYFDDAFHRMLGLDGESFQSLYHFTVGAPVDDTRLTTLPGYFHLDRGQA
ncbi:MAG TPA: SagB/ThcOx family dehydrogenase [Candidatus Methylomirabilis sp.]